MRCVDCNKRESTVYARDTRSPWGRGRLVCSDCGDALIWGEGSRWLLVPLVRRPEPLPQGEFLPEA